ncbi:MAG: hypothetical protein HQM15_11850 [Deltaproteobacteria bacterium]|nr:hypothetical protein [Deltaproteobacteria bacterium]
MNSETEEERLAAFLKQNRPLPQAPHPNDYVYLLQRIAREHQQRSLEVLFRFLKYALPTFGTLALLALLVLPGYWSGNWNPFHHSIRNEEIGQYLAEASLFLEDSSSSNRETELASEDWVWLAETVSSNNKMDSDSSNFTED